MEQIAGTDTPPVHKRGQKQEPHTAKIHHPPPASFSGLPGSGSAAARPLWQTPPPPALSCVSPSDWGQQQQHSQGGGGCARESRSFGGDGGSRPDRADEELAGPQSRFTSGGGRRERSRASSKKHT